MLARGRMQLGAVTVAIALVAPASAFALSTSHTEIGSHADVRARGGSGERYFQRTRSMPAVRNAPKVAVESRKWVSPDPLFLNDPTSTVKRPLEGGLYGYVGNNPVNGTDPSGFGPEMLTPQEQDDAGLPPPTIETVKAQALMMVAMANPLAGLVLAAASAGMSSGATLGDALVIATAGVAESVSALRGVSSSAASVRGGIAPVLKGRAGEAMSEAEAVTAGETVLGKQVTFELPSGRTAKPDLLTRTSEGNLKVREAKYGPTAKLTPGQRELQSAAQNGEAVTPRGANAEKAGLKPGEQVCIQEFELDSF